MKKVRKKPVVVEAVEVIPSNIEEIRRLTGTEIKYVSNEEGHNSFTVFVNTLEGIMEAFEGNFIIRGIEGEVYPCRADIFHKTYEEVTD